MLKPRNVERRMLRNQNSYEGPHGTNKHGPKNWPIHISYAHKMTELRPIKTVEERLNAQISTVFTAG